MSTIPLPALSIRPPEQQDMAANLGRLMQLKQMAQEAPLRQQLMQQQAQAGQLKIQDAQRQQTDQKALTTAYQQWDGKDPHSLAVLTLKNGGSADAVNSVLNDAAARADKYSTIAKNDSVTGKNTIATMLDRNKMISGALEGVLSASDEQLPQSITTTAQNLSSQGLLDPQHVQMATQIAQSGDPKAMRNAVELFRKGYMSDSQILEEARQAESERHNRAMETKPSDMMQGMNDFLQAKAAEKGAPLTAAEGVKYRQEYYQRNKSATSVSMGATGQNDIRDTAQMISGGQAPPVLTEYSFRDRTKLAAELHRQGYDLAQAEQDWKATQKMLSTMNGAQQVRLRQALSFANDTLPQIQQAYDAWKATGLPSGFKLFNKAALNTAANLPGEAGSKAKNLQALIADFTSELGTVYKGGNSSTDESLKLAAQNLQADWNDQTFGDAMKRIGQSLKIRKNSMSMGAAGLSAGSQYNVPNTNQPQQEQSGPMTITLPSGKTVKIE